MSTTATDTTADKVFPPNGRHKARCFHVVDHGKQFSEFKGEGKWRPKIRLGFELPECTHVFKEEDGPQTMRVFKKFTLNLGSQSNLRPFLESWRNKEFTKEELKGFDLKRLLNAPCEITLMKRTSEAGNEYCSIENIALLSKQDALDPVEIPVYFNTDLGPDSPEFKALHDWEREEIAKCQEWQPAPNQESPSLPTKTVEVVPDDSDDIPF